MPKLVNRVLRTPWGFGVVVAVALAGIVANDYAHRHTLAGLTESQAVAEVIRQANLAHYNALDRVNSLRAYLLEPHPRWIARYHESDGQLGASVAAITAFLAQRPQASGRVLAEGLSDLFARRTADLARGWAHAQADRPDEALRALRESDAAGLGTALRAALQQGVELAQADRREADSRLLTSIRILRWVVHALLAAMVLAAYALLRQTQLIDASRKQQAELLSNEVAARTAQLRELAGHLITTREDERARLARELHDEMGGLLSVIKLDLARLRRHPELPDKARRQCEMIDGRLSEVVSLKRQVIENLRPSALDHLGLPQALEMLCRENALAMDVPTHHDVAPIRLAPELELTIYRIVQEALTNARKYSRARQVWVALRTEGEQVHLIVEDDGIGFDEAAVGPGHHGLAGMRLRVESQAGRIEVGPRGNGRGSRIHAVLPAPARSTSAGG
jgi:signal transduction histidine kinase